MKSLLQSLTDDKLVKLYASGTNEAFDVLLERYQDRLYSYISYTLQNDDEAEDVFQETFVKAIVHIRNGKYLESGKFYPWLTRIAHNLIIDHYRYCKNDCPLSNDEANDAYFNNISRAEACIESHLIAEQTLDEVRKLVELLPENQRDVVRMRYYQELSFKEISDITGVSIGTALGRMHYALNNMRKLAKQYQLCCYVN
ncbi:RNA polymerase sigma-70 factor, ECF subfamily [gut metagenome]|uniref:RNA polymerase sigma-70 factor, ECF subfamily n=1 Tax=gut metagenome TaxID=749906 RepID=J9G568_9ZZZZ